ncbi:MAG TPA: hypothetical protein VIM56_06325 [Rhizomicrobium sp.]
MTREVLLGYEVGSAAAISIPVAHMAVTGQTQQSGKTTTLEALVSRSGLTALTFVTKRGEKSFADGARVQPYFRDRADWQFVTSIIDATLQEKNKFLRPWIMKICRNTRTLADVHGVVREKLETATGINEGVYTQLDAYLDLIVGEIDKAELAPTLDLKPGLNVMDVSGFRTEMQMLFIQSALDWVNERCHDTIVVIPEAWEFVPQAKSSPVKASATTLVRKGAALGNFIWIDSQDMAGVDKTILRGCTVWLMGAQRESNEIKRNLENIPAGMQRPKAQELALLERGQFFACFKHTVAKTYVRPAWMNDADAIATSKTTRMEVQSSGALFSTIPADRIVSPQLVGKLVPDVAEIEADIRKKLEEEMIDREARSFARGRESLIRDLQPKLDVLAGDINMIGVRIDDIQAILKPPPTYAVVVPGPSNFAIVPGEAQAFLPNRTEGAATSSSKPDAAEIDFNPGAPVSRLLAALSEMEAMGVKNPSRAIVAFLCNYTHIQSKPFVQAIAMLKDGQLIEIPESGKLALTDEGRKVARPADFMRTPEAIRKRIAELLGGAAGKIIDILVKAYPESVPRIELAARAGYTHVQSKPFVEALSKLRELGFAELPRPKDVRAGLLLFPETASHVRSQ